MTNPGVEMADAIVESLEKQCESKVFTIRVDSEESEESKMGFIAVFEDKSMLQGHVTFDFYEEGVACRIQGNYL